MTPMNGPSKDQFLTPHRANCPADEHIPQPHMTKRNFLKLCGMSFCALATASLFGFPDFVRAQMAQKGLIKTKLSPFYRPLGGGEIQCELCPRRCRVPPPKPHTPSGRVHIEFVRLQEERRRGRVSSESAPNPFSACKPWHF